MSATFALGIMLEISSGIAGVIGKQFIGLSARDGKPLRARAIFVLGMFMTTVVGAALDAVAYGFAPQSVIAPLGGLEITMNILFAPCILKETVAPAHVIGTVLVASGASLTAVFGPRGGAPPTLDELQAKLFRWQVLLYVGVFGFSLLTSFAILRSRPRGTGDKIRGILLGIVAGAVAGNMCFVKCLMGLLVLGFGGDWSPWTNWLPYVLAVLAASVAVGNVPLMVMGLREYEAVFMVTLFGGSSIVMACISGDIILLEMSSVKPLTTLAYWGSVLIIILGLVAINSTTVRGIGDDANFEMQESLTDDRDCLGESLARRRGSLCTLRDRLPTEAPVLILWANPVAGVAAAGIKRRNVRAATWAGDALATSEHNETFPVEKRSRMATEPASFGSLSRDNIQAPSAT